MKLPYHAAIPLLGIYPKRNIMQKDTCTPKFTVAIFTIARTWKQARYPTSDEQIRELEVVVYIQNGMLYLAIKMKEFLSALMKQMKLEPIIQSEVSQIVKDKCQILMYIYRIQKDSTEDPICWSAKEEEK